MIISQTEQIPGKIGELRLPLLGQYVAKSISSLKAILGLACTSRTGHPGMNEKFY